MQKEYKQPFYVNNPLARKIIQTASKDIYDVYSMIHSSVT